MFQSRAERLFHFFGPRRRTPHRSGPSGTPAPVRTIQTSPLHEGLRTPREAKAAQSIGVTLGRRTVQPSSQPNPDELTALASTFARQFVELSPAQRIAQLRREITGRIVFTTSFGLEDQAILHLLCEGDENIEVVTLDTGRLFPETYTLWAEVERRYARRIPAFYPRQDDLEALVQFHGINGFYESREARTACCYVRKVEPLNRALAGARAWITGLRADQSAQRRDMALVEADADRGLIKLNAFFDWTRDQVLTFVSANNVPINPLHATGFASIGCAPCTRAIAPGQPERAGRWWWEEEGKKECGLHTNGS